MGIMIGSQKVVNKEEPSETGIGLSGLVKGAYQSKTLLSEFARNY